MGSSGASRGGGGGTFRGTWASSTVYNAGDTVIYDGALYGTASGAAADVLPVVETILYSSIPTSLDTVDPDLYQFRALCQVSQRVRLTGLGFYKAALQVAIPHELRVYDSAISTTAPLASALAVGEASDTVGQVFAPVIADLLPGRNYSFTLVTGAGSDAGYRYQTSFAFPLASGSMTMSAGGYSSSHANITTINSAANYYSGVTPRWEEPSASWTLIGRLDAVIAGSDRDVFVPLVSS